MPQSDSNEQSQWQDKLPEVAGEGLGNQILFANDLGDALRKLDEMMETTLEDDEETSSEELSFTDSIPFGSLRGAPTTSRSLQLLKEDGDHDGNWDCLNMDIVDACRGTSVSKKYRGNFKLFEGKCKGDFVDDLPIYVSSDRPNQPLYIYPLGVYPEGWSVAALRGLVRWRIVSFENFDDKTSCRTESANIFQIEFAADGQPYNYYPTIYCFDENGSDFSGFKSSTINIRCNDKADTIGGSNPGGGGKTAGIVIGIILALLAAVAAYCYWKRAKDRGQSLCPSPTSKNYDDDDYDSRYYPQSRADESRFTSGSRFTRGSLFSRDTGTKESRDYSRETGTRDSRDVEEYVDEAPLDSKKSEAHTNSDKTPDTVYVPTVEELSEPSYVDEVIEDPINDLNAASNKKEGFPGKLKIPEMFSKLAAPMLNNKDNSDAISDIQPSVSSPPPSPRRDSVQDTASIPSKSSHKKAPIPAPSGHGPSFFDGRSTPQKHSPRSEPQKHPSRSAISRDITDIVEEIDRELDDVISSGDGRNRKGRDDYASGASSDDGRSADYSGSRGRRTPSPTSNERNRSRSRDAPPKRRFSGFGSSAHSRDGRSQPRKKDPFMDLSRRTKFKEIRKNFSDKSRALGRSLSGHDKRSRSEERSRPDAYASRGRDTSGHRDGRSRSMDRWANANKNRSRSQSRERSNNFLDRSGRSTSKERSNHGDRRDGRSLSRERSKAAEYYSNRQRPTSRDRNGSSGYADKDRNRSRSRSTERSGANDFANHTRDSRSKTNGSNRMSKSDHNGNRRSNGSPPGRNRLGASSEHSGKPSSDGWASSGEQAAKRRGRSSSPERSRHDYRGRSPSPYKEQNQSVSRDKANDFANRKGRSSSHDRSGRPTSTQRPRNPSFSNPIATTGRSSPVRGRGTLDASQLGKTITKNEDGSVTVAVKRTREDGAIVTTRTKYASVGLAKRHGIEIE